MRLFGIASHSQSESKFSWFFFSTGSFMLTVSRLNRYLLRVQQPRRRRKKNYGYLVVVVVVVVVPAKVSEGSSIVSVYTIYHTID